MREKVRAKRTNRQCTKEYTGNAGAVVNKRPEKKGLYRKSRRNCYVNSGLRNLGQEGSWDGKKDEENYGKNSIVLPLNERDTTQGEAQKLNLTTTIKSIIAPIQDVLKTTRKENVIGNPRPNGNFNAQIPSKITVHDPNDVARTTIKETNIHDNRTGNMAGPKKLTVYDPNDIARTTIKETNIHDVRTGNMSGPNKITVHDPNDIARTTIKETNIHDVRTGNMNGPVKKLLFMILMMSPEQQLKKQIFMMLELEMLVTKPKEVNYIIKTKQEKQLEKHLKKLKKQSIFLEIKNKQYMIQMIFQHLQLKILIFIT